MLKILAVVFDVGLMVNMIWILWQDKQMYPMQFFLLLILCFYGFVLVLDEDNSPISFWLAEECTETC
ncbi:MAG: hypothetical protein AAB870_04770, partial [Patescibacteria group bacterium]